MEDLQIEYASNGKGNLGVTLGAIGTGLGVLNNGGLGFLGNMGTATQQYVTKEAFDLSMQLSKSERDNAILSAELNTEKKMVEVYNALNEKINKVVSDQAGINAAQAVTNTATTSAIAVLQNNTAQLMALTKLVIPNSSTCPGWGEVKITPAQ